MAATLGITCDFVTHKNARGMDVARHAATRELVQRVALAGARPVLLPHLTHAQEHLGSIAGLDGLIVSGGDFDVPPALFGEAPHPRLGRVVPERTHSELRLIALAEHKGLPILGLCGGMQLLNVYKGGTLIQDLSLRPNTDVHEQPYDTRTPSHAVRIEPDSLLARWLGTQSSEVNSTHHQVIGRLADSLVATAWAPDGVVEALEAKNPSTTLLGVQWHPELLGAAEHARLFEAFVARCCTQAA